LKTRITIAIIAAWQSTSHDRVPWLTLGEHVTVRLTISSRCYRLCGVSPSLSTLPSNRGWWGERGHPSPTSPRATVGWCSRWPALLRRFALSIYSPVNTADAKAVGSPWSGASR